MVSLNTKESFSSSFSMSISFLSQVDVLMLLGPNFSLIFSLAVNAGARAPRGGVTRQGVVLTDLQSLGDCQ